MPLGVPQPPSSFINGSPIEVVDKFSYLESVVNSSNHVHEKISQQIRQASTNFVHSCSRVWKSHCLTIKLKVRVYYTCALLCSSEIWCTCSLISHLAPLHSCVFRRDRGTNSNILLVTGSHDLIIIVIQRRLRCVGDVGQMEGDYWPQDITNSEFHNVPRRTSIPKLCTLQGHYQA